MLLFVVVNSIDLPSLLNLISQTSAVSPPTKNVSKGPYIRRNKSNLVANYPKRNERKQIHYTDNARTGKSVLKTLS